MTASLHVSAHKKRKRSGLGDKEGGSDCSNEDIEDAVPGVAPSLLYAGARFEWNSSFSEEGLGALFGWHLLTIDGLRALLAGKPHEELAAFRMSEDNAVVRVVNGILVRILSNRPKLDSVLIPSKQPDRAFEVGSSNIDGKRRKLEDLRSKAGEVASIDHSGNVPMILRAARLKAKRVYENQDFCQLCWDGGDLLLCDLCPASYHPKIQCVTNYTCMPVSHHRARWKCPLHKCGLCQQPSEDVKLLFACEICPAAYCESCLAPGAKVVGACARFESMGHRLLSGSVYIHCSKECAYFAANEAENEIRQMDEMNKNRRENSEVGVNGGSAEQPLTSLAEQSKKMVKPRHAYKKVPSDLVASENELPRLNPSAFDEILLRLGGVGSSHLIVRFRNLLEIAGFEERWNNLPSDSQEKFANLIASANRFYESLQQTSDGTINAVINCNRNPVAWMKSLVFSYCGFPFGNNAGPHQAGIVYKIMTKFMDSWTVHLLVGVCALLGIGLVLPILDNSARRGPVSEPIFRYH